MKKIKWQYTLGFFLVLASAVLYFAHFVIFKDVHHIFIYLIGDIAFIPLEVLIVTLIIHKFLTDREKKSLLSKLNMVIGVFYSEVGASLLSHFSSCNSNLESLKSNLVVKNEWQNKDFTKAERNVVKMKYDIDLRGKDLNELRDYLVGKRPFLMRLLENPNLLEHNSFTNLLWAVFHLTEELSVRKNLKQLSSKDMEHLAVDVKRAYVSLVSGWLLYMKHLQCDYPYLFSLATRTNPLDDNVSPEIK